MTSLSRIYDHKNGDYKALNASQPINTANNHSHLPISRSSIDRASLHKKKNGLSDMEIKPGLVGFIAFILGLFMILANRMKINQLSERMIKRAQK